MDSNKSAQSPKSGGCLGMLKRFWYYLCFMVVGTKWNIIELFTFHKKLDIQKIPRRQGDVAVITGGARGIGVEVIRKLLILDMHVIIGCRNEQAGQDVVEKLRKEGVSTGAAHTFKLDLKSLESVREFAGKVLKKYRRINLLINNAGIMLAPYECTKDNFESHFQVNYLSHFLLTQLLLPKLKTTGTAQKPSRIVNVSSIAAYGGKINFEDLQMSELYSPSLAYMTTKMMQVIFTRDMETRLKSEGANVHIYAVHPGVVSTDLYENMCICGCLTKLFFKTPKQGSDCVMFAAVSPKVNDKGGSFFGNCKKMSIPSGAKSVEIHKKLWDISCELTGLASGSKAALTTFSVENENIRTDDIVVSLDSRVGEADSDTELYETKSTAAGSPNEKHIENETQKEINKDLARKIINSIENNTELAITAISKELVDDVVGKSENIVNERVNTQPDFIHSASSKELVSEILSKENSEENSNETAHKEQSQGSDAALPNNKISSEILVPQQIHLLFGTLSLSFLFTGKPSLSIL